MLAKLRKRRRSVIQAHTDTHTHNHYYYSTLAWYGEKKGSVMVAND